MPISDIARGSKGTLVVYATEGSDRLVGMRLAGLTSIASAVIAAVAVVLLFAMSLAFVLGATTTGQTIGGILAALYVGYLLLAFRLGRSLVGRIG